MSRRIGDEKFRRRNTLYLEELIKSGGGGGSAAQLPVKEDGTVDCGTVGQVAISDGKGGITWSELFDGNGVSY